MAEQATQTKSIEPKADALPIVEAVQVSVAEAGKTAESVEAVAPKAEAVVKAAVKAADKAAAPLVSAAKPATVAARKPKAAALKAKLPKAQSPKAKSPKARIEAQPVKPVARIAKTAAPVAAGPKAIKTGVKTMTTQTNKTAAAGFAAAEQIKTVVADANERAKTAMEKSAKIIEELAELGRGNVEAIVASSKVAAKGVEGLSQDAANYSRKSFEEATAAFKSFADVKSATDFFKLQGDFARSAFDAAVAESARVSESVLKLAGDVAEPLTSRYAVAAERVKTLAA